MGLSKTLAQLMNCPLPTNNPHIIMTIKQLVGLRKKEYHNFWTCPLNTNNTHIIMTKNQAHKQI